MDAQAALALITLPVQDVCTERSRQLEELFHAGVAHVRQEMTGLRKQQGITCSDGPALRALVGAQDGIDKENAGVAPTAFSSARAVVNDGDERGGTVEAPPERRARRKRDAPGAPPASSSGATIAPEVASCIATDAQDAVVQGEAARAAASSTELCMPCKRKSGATDGSRGSDASARSAASRAGGVCHDPDSLPKRPRLAAAQPTMTSAPRPAVRTEIELNPRQWTVVQLREELRKRGLSTNGLKQALLQRLQEAMRAEADQEAAECDEFLQAEAEAAALVRSDGSAAREQEPGEGMAVDEQCELSLPAQTLDAVPAADRADEVDEAANMESACPATDDGAAASPSAACGGGYPAAPTEIGCCGGDQERAASPSAADRGGRAEQSPAVAPSVPAPLVALSLPTASPAGASTSASSASPVSLGDRARAEQDGLAAVQEVHASEAGASTDTGTDVGASADIDVGIVAGIDAGVDAGIDAGRFDVGADAASGNAGDDVAPSSTGRLSQPASPRDDDGKRLREQRLREDMRARLAKHQLLQQRDEVASEAGEGDAKLGKHALPASRVSESRASVRSSDGNKEHDVQAEALVVQLPSRGGSRPSDSSCAAVPSLGGGSVSLSSGEVYVSNQHGVPACDEPLAAPKPDRSQQVKLAAEAMREAARKRARERADQVLGSEPSPHADRATTALVASPVAVEALSQAVEVEEEVGKSAEVEAASAGADGVSISGRSHDNEGGAGTSAEPRAPVNLCTALHSLTALVAPPPCSSPPRPKPRVNALKLAALRKKEDEAKEAERRRRKEEALRRRQELQQQQQQPLRAGPAPAVAGAVGAAEGRKVRAQEDRERRARGGGDKCKRGEDQDATAAPAGPSASAPGSTGTSLAEGPIKPSPAPPSRAAGPAQQDAPASSHMQIAALGKHLSAAASSSDSGEPATLPTSSHVLGTAAAGDASVLVSGTSAAAAVPAAVATVAAVTAVPLTALAAAPASSGRGDAGAAAAAATAAAAPTAAEAASYEISDHEQDMSDDDEESRADRREKIPSWARRPALEATLRAQFQRGPGRVDPDSIFPEVTTCNLEDIFRVRKPRYNRRNSSGNWIPDRVTARERQKYRNDMGY